MNSLTLYALLILGGVSVGGGVAYWSTANAYKVEVADCNAAIEKGNTEAITLKAEHAAKIAEADKKAAQIITDNEVSKNETAHIISDLADNVRMYQERQQHRLAAAAATGAVARADRPGDLEEDTRIQDACIADLPEAEYIAGIAERCINTTLNNCGIAKP